MSISNRTELRLTLLNVAVFAAVLVTFSVCVFAAFVHKLQQDTLSDLRHLADAAVASIDFDEDKTRNPASAQPDLIASAMPDSSAGHLNALKLQWFDYNGKFAFEKGTFVVNIPLNRTEGFETLKEPRGIMFTKPVMDDGHLLGYVRVAQPLDTQERAIANLIGGLILGTVAALIVSGAGMALVVRQSILPLRVAMQKLRQFTADASHELRTPIMAIQTNSSVALKYPDGMRSGDKEKFEMIHQSGLQMNRLVEDLLLLSRADHSSAELGRANLSSVVREACAELGTLTENKRTRIKIDIADNIELCTPADDLRRIVSNLVENAIRYTSDDGNVTIRSEIEGPSVLLTVQDDGVGIAAQDIDKVFDRFWRADKTRMHNGSGQGLGLAITKALVERHKGAITVESEVGTGTIFSVSLRPAIFSQPDVALDTAG